MSINYFNLWADARIFLRVQRYVKTGSQQELYRNLTAKETQIKILNISDKEEQVIRNFAQKVCPVFY
jgi:hypothetical protein